MHTKQYHLFSLLTDGIVQWPNNSWDWLRLLRCQRWKLIRPSSNINALSANPDWAQNLNLIITMPADALSYVCAVSSAGTIKITKIYMLFSKLTNWGRVTLICVSKLTIIGSDNGLSPGRRQAIIWINAGILLIRPLKTNFSEILIKIHIFSFKKIHLKTSSGKWRSFCLGLNELIRQLMIFVYLCVDQGHILLRGSS